MNGSVQKALVFLAAVAVVSCSNSTGQSALPNIITSSQANKAPQQPVPMDDSYGPDVSVGADSGGSGDDSSGGGGAPSGDCMYLAKRGGYKTALCGGGGGGGGVTVPHFDAGCGSAVQTAGKAYAQLNSSNPGIFNAPNPSSSTPNGQEAYGWIYQNNSSGAFVYSPPAIETVSSSNTVSIGSPPTYSGYTFEGTYHTHPFNPDAPSMIDSTTGNNFSVDDESYAASTGAPIYVGVDDTIGDQSASEASGRWYQYNPSTKAQTLEGSLGQGGC